MTQDGAQRGGDGALRPSLLIVAGLDPSGGAGLIADVRVADSLGFRAVGVVTALTEQDTRGLRAVHPVSAEIVADQLRMLLADVEVAAVKIGALGSEVIAEAVADALALTAAPAVWDPVLAPSRGRVHLYDGDPRRAVAILGPHTAVLTPNAREAEALCGLRVTDEASMRAAARALCELGVDAALVKGGHVSPMTSQASESKAETSRDGALATAHGDRTAGTSIDVLVAPRAGIELTLRGPTIPGGADVHGTGCALSTALACQLGLGASLADAARAAKAYVAARLASPQAPGRGARTVL